MIAGGMLIVSGLLYVLFTDASLQQWNTPKNKLGGFATDELQENCHQNDCLLSKSKETDDNGQHCKT